VRISAAKRRSLPKSDFADPKHRKYPDDTKGRARNALARAAQNASPALQAKVRAKVRRDYPSIKQAERKHHVPHNAITHQTGR
jgi:hypothetical protein